jgi:hypothetical protein
MLLELPVFITVRRPTWRELLRVAGGLLLAGAARRREHTRGRLILLDGEPNGSTPTTIAVPPGQHTLVFQAPEAIPQKREVAVTGAGASLEVHLWRARPIVHYLQPSLPGGSLVDATFLDDGRLGLVLELPGGERQAWLVDPADHFHIERLGASASRGALTIRADGAWLSSIGPRNPSGAPTAASVDHLAAIWDERTTKSPQAARLVWAAAPTGDEDLVDLVWAPDRQHLLVVGRQHLGFGADRTSLRWLDSISGTGELLALLPSEAVRGSFVWSADGSTAAFLAHSASLTALCTLSATGAFRYLGDLGHNGMAGPPVAPVAWAADGRLAYGALLQKAPGSSRPTSAFGRPPVGPYVVDAAGGPGRPIGREAGLAPLWRLVLIRREKGLIREFGENRVGRPSCGVPGSPATPLVVVRAPISPEVPESPFFRANLHMGR